MTDLGNKLKIIRLRHSILSKYVAQILGIQYRNYQRYENGELDLQMRKIKVLCDLFGISADWLLDINEEIYSHKLIAKREYELMPTFMELPLPTVLKHIYFNKREEFYSLDTYLSNRYDFLSCSLIQIVKLQYNVPILLCIGCYLLV